MGLLHYKAGQCSSASSTRTCCSLMGMPACRDMSAICCGDMLLNMDCMLSSMPGSFSSAEKSNRGLCPGLYHSRSSLAVPRSLVSVHSPTQA